jgi:hypothetical protein
VKHNQKTLFCVALGGLVVALSLIAPAASAQETPNIVFIWG